MITRQVATKLAFLVQKEQDPIGAWGAIEADNCIGQTPFYPEDVFVFTFTDYTTVEIDAETGETVATYPGEEPEY